MCIRDSLYSDPTALPLRRAIADTYGLSPDNVFCGNGSDEVLDVYKRQDEALFIEFESGNERFIIHRCHPPQGAWVRRFR